MDRLKDEFGNQIEFVDLNYDDPSLNPVRDQYGITNRSQYALVNTNGEVIKRWFGYIDEADVAGELESFLANP